MYTFLSLKNWVLHFGYFIWQNKYKAIQEAPSLLHQTTKIAIQSSFHLLFIFEVVIFLCLFLLLRFGFSISHHLFNKVHGFLIRAFVL